ncbi:hypothetical protein [Bradyrhizobium jicamae]|uniref:hypothetical protein n=1 Tax=Bradyrhizobium jicamae TaxID=280332 RepID=UPI001BAC7390|nr:hypothetical protein [Bradyrhizobium jicamae]MBR0939385.1 hypothetical protein [Bradyrhizobium jicamae]
MRDIAELLERKRTLLDRRQDAEPGLLAVVELELEEIDRTLTRLESRQMRRPVALHWAGQAPNPDPARRAAARSRL